MVLVHSRFEKEQQVFFITIYNDVLLAATPCVYCLGDTPFAGPAWGSIFCVEIAGVFQPVLHAAARFPRQKASVISSYERTSDGFLSWSELDDLGIWKVGGKIVQDFCCSLLIFLWWPLKNMITNARAPISKHKRGFGT